MTPTTINTLFVETPQGDRSFSLVHGDLSDEPSAMLVFSTHAGSGRPLGMVLDALESRFGPLDLDSAGLVLSLAGHSPFRLSDAPDFHDSAAGVYWVEPAAGMVCHGLLMVRLPGAVHFPSPQAALTAYHRAVGGVFSAMAALEFQGQQYPSLSLPVLGGARAYPKQEAIGMLLQAAMDWLAVSRFTSSVNFVITNDADIDAWSSAMDSALGRTFLADEDYSTASSELRDRLVEQIQALLHGEKDPCMRHVLTDLQAAMAQAPVQASIQHIGVLGRLVAEAMAARLCRDLGITPGPTAFGNIEKLQQVPSISKWINSYLHSLRVLGNESVHIAERDQRIPQTLAAGDLVVIFGNMARVLDFYRVWRARRGATMPGSSKL